MKTCSKCGESKPLEAYGPDKRASDGCQSSCRYCQAAQKKDFVRANPEIKKKQDARYYIKNCEKIKARTHEYYLANPEKVAFASAQYEKNNRAKVNKTKRAWKKANAEKVSTGNARYRKANPEVSRRAQATYYKNNQGKMLLKGHIRRALKTLNGVNRVLDSETAAIIAMSCAACGSAGPSTVDHIVPIARGGAHTIGNLMPLCQSCNSSKHDMLYIEWKHSKRPQAKKVFAA